MARSPKQDVSQDATPKTFPEVPPPVLAQTVSTMHLVESMMQMQQALGELKSDVGHLKGSSDKQSKKLDRISHIIFATGVVLAIAATIFGFIMNKIWDGLITLLTRMPLPPAH
ncbi:hypothetical protein SAMN05216573_12261 [Bradyrhizobium sp. Rc3b]|uniref:hypothetical protein n=1 Tax=Bradyrhizobium sp. Rc3b TaxID=1855322 RepID=UPI0008E68A81|nr:hypothetical protein [Bradyrhizobium sp. Rc3b]SFN80974.1 hypothetical protein SAMN05216573_12261 [Bradyrhizobium sp. Rc3b]